MQTDKKRTPEEKKSTALAREYRALQGEYTRRCQELSALRGENDALKSRIASLEGDYRQMTDYPALMQSDEFIERYIMADEGIKRRIIDEYLRSLARPQPPATLCGGVGRTALTPVPRPKSLAEAKKLAEIVIRG